MQIFISDLFGNRCRIVYAFFICPIKIYKDMIRKDVLVLSMPQYHDGISVYNTGHQRSCQHGNKR